MRRRLHPFTDDLVFRVSSCERHFEASLVCDAAAAYLRPARDCALRKRSRALRITPSKSVTLPEQSPLLSTGLRCLSLRTCAKLDTLNLRPTVKPVRSLRKFLKTFQAFIEQCVRFAELADRLLMAR